MQPGVAGKVTAVNGTTITISGRAIGSGMMGAPGSSGKPATPPAAVTYTVDASGATVKKDNATSTVSSIAVGDTIFAQGTVSGTNVTAVSIRDGFMMGRTSQGQGRPGMMGSSSPVLDQSAPSGAKPAPGKGGSPGFFGGIGQFFMHLFGF